MNQINTIRPYRFGPGWVFDDPAKGLDKEAFVAGADTFLDFLTQGANSCLIQFSAAAFPGALELTKTGGDFGGTYYWFAPTGHSLWLCPALLKYFDHPPESIWFTYKV